MAQARFTSGPRKGQFKPKNGKSTGSKKSGGSRGSKIKATVSRHTSKINKAIKGGGILAGVLAFVQQTTAEDVKFAKSTGYYQGLNGENKAKFLVGKLIGRATGFTVFGNVAGEAPDFKINLWGPVNKWTGIGVGGLIYKTLGGYFNLPYRNHVRNFTAPILIGGIVGGLIDPPGDSSGPAPTPSRNQVSAGTAVVMRI